MFSRGGPCGLRAVLQMGGGQLAETLLPNIKFYAEQVLGGLPERAACLVDNVWSPGW